MTLRRRHYCPFSQKEMLIFYLKEPYLKLHFCLRLLFVIEIFQLLFEGSFKYSINILASRSNRFTIFAELLLFTPKLFDKLCTSVKLTNT